MIKTKEKQKEYDIIHLLGGPNLINMEINTVFDLIELSNYGLKKASLDHLIAYMGLTKKYIAEQILHLSTKTLERKKEDDLLDTQISSHIIEIAKVVEHAYAVFENEEKVKRWLNSPNRGLHQKSPIELFHLPTGLMLVDNLLGRIEEGVYS